MATLTLLARPSSGGPQAAAAADILIGSNIKSHASTALTLEAAATQMLLKVNGTTLLTLSGASTTTLTSAGTTQIDAPTGGTIAFTINNIGQMSISGSGINAQVALSMSSNKITGLSQGTASGEALSYPWVGSENSSSSLSNSSFTLNQSTTTYQDIGLSVTLPSAGTYRIIASVRTSISCSSGAGAFIIGKLYNSTDSADITNSDRILSQANVINQLMQITSIIEEVITVAASKTIKVYCARVFSGTVTASSIDSDGNGKSRISYVKISA